MKTIRHRTALAGAIILAAGLAPAETVLSLTIDGNQDTNQHDGRPDRRLYRREPGRDLRGREPPGRGRGGQLVRTRLATGEAGDILQYNSGSLFQALNPVEQLADLSDSQANIIDSFKPVVTATDGTVRGVPFGSAMGGGI